MELDFIKVSCRFSVALKGIVVPPMCKMSPPIWRAAAGMLLCYHFSLISFHVESSFTICSRSTEVSHQSLGEEQSRCPVPVMPGRS